MKENYNVYQNIVRDYGEYRYTSRKLVAVIPAVSAKQAIYFYTTQNKIYATGYPTRQTNNRGAVITLSWTTEASVEPLKEYSSRRLVNKTLRSGHLKKYAVRLFDRQGREYSGISVAASDIKAVNNVCYQNGLRFPYISGYCVDEIAA